MAELMLYQEFGSAWPDGVPVQLQVHATVAGPFLLGSARP